MLEKKMFASKNFLDLLRQEMKDPSFREGFKDNLLKHANIDNDVCYTLSEMIFFLVKP